MLKQKKSENPFYGEKKLLSLLKTGSRGAFSSLLSSTYKACTTKLSRIMFHIICFSLGDIVNRQHNIYGKKKIDQGGNSLNEQWIEYLTFLINNDKKQFVSFLPIIVEYVGWRELLTYQIKTKKGKSNIIGHSGLLKLIMNEKECYKALLKELKNHISSEDIMKQRLVAKWLNSPRFSKRKGKDGKLRSLQPKTVEKMKLYGKLLTDLSKLMDWKIVIKETYTRYTGFTEWRKPFNTKFEFYVFSSGLIHTMGRESFLKFLDQVPNGGRDRIKRRFFTKDGIAEETYAKQAKWYKEWENFKVEKQAEVRVLEVKAASTGLSESEKETLKKAKKVSKVNTGAKTIASDILNLMAGKADQVTIDSIISKVKFDVPLLCAIDTSGSMSSRYAASGVIPIEMAKLLLACALYKNPDPEGTLDMFIDFNTSGKFIVEGQPFSKNMASNRFLKEDVVKSSKLIDRKKSFIQVYDHIRNIVNTPGGGTNPSGIFTAINSWVKGASSEVERQHRIEELNKYPVIMIVSDGHFNSGYSTTSSIEKMQKDLATLNGYSPVIVIWDICDKPKSENSYEGLENVIHITGKELGTINSVFTNLTDLDIVDIYTVLNTLYRSNRYELVKESVL